MSSVTGRFLVLQEAQQCGQHLSWAGGRRASRWEGRERPALRTRPQLAGPLFPVEEQQPRLICKPCGTTNLHACLHLGIENIIRLMHSLTEF